MLENRSLDLEIGEAELESIFLLRFELHFEIVLII